MSLADVFKKLGANSTFTKVIDTAETAISIIPIAGSIYGAFKTIINFFTGGPDPIMEKLQELEDKMNQAFHELLNAVEAEDIHNTMEHISTFNGEAKTELQTVLNFKAGDPEFDISDLNDRSSNAVTTLMEDPYWFRVFYDVDTYSNGWAGQLKPPADDKNGSTFKFDYLYILPAYLQTLTCRLIVMGAIEPNFRIKFQQEINSHANFLLEKHEKIRNAIVGLRAPAKNEIWSEFDSTGYIDADGNNHYIVGYSDKFCWNHFDRIYGAVELYSGFDYTDTYQDTRLFELRYGQWSQDSEPTLPYPCVIENDSYKIDLDEDLYHTHFLPTFAVRTFRQKRNLYIDFLSASWGIINKLYILAGQQPLSMDINYSIWSLRRIKSEIDNLLNSMGYNPLPEEISLRDLAFRLEVKDSIISLRNMLEVL
jgi:hypothetical protein